MSRDSFEASPHACLSLKPIEDVVVGTSLLEGSDDVVTAAVDVARAVRGRLTLVHCLPVDALVPRFGTGWSESEFYRKWSASQQVEMDAQIERVKPGVPVTTRLESGSPHRSILKTAGTLGADLIVIGASDRGRFASFLGSTADRVLRRAGCPVLVVRGDWRFPIQRILAPIDFSPLSAEALECAIGFLSQLGAAEPRVELFFAVSALQRSQSEPFTEGRLETVAVEELRRFGEESVGDCDCELECRASMGEPAQEILREADRFEADLVVVATNGRGGIERALLGSVARMVATEARHSVLFIPPEVALGAAVAEAVLEETEPRWLDPPVKNGAGQGGPS